MIFVCFGAGRGKADYDFYYSIFYSTYGNCKHCFLCTYVYVKNKAFLYKYMRTVCYAQDPKGGLLNEQ